MLRRASIPLSGILAVCTLLTPRLSADPQETNAPSENVASTITPTSEPSTETNPFRIIPARNAFGIKDPPPPPPPVQEAPPPPPPPPPANVTLTGFSLWKGRKKVYLQITPPGGKNPVYRDLEEGSEQDDIRILAIDEKNETVQILNAGQEFTLNFKENGAKPSPTPGGAPGAIPNPVTTAVVNTAAGRSGPVVIGRGGVTDANFDPGQLGSQIPGATMGTPNQSAGALGNVPNRQGRAINSPDTIPANAVIAVPGQDRVVGGVRIPAPPPLPVPSDFAVPQPPGQ
jgi:hypothetical protein